MVDIYSKEKRSDIMSRIRSTGTTPETKLYALARDVLGPRPRMLRHPKTLPGTPDLYVPSLKLALFADGCFFHGCPAHGHIPHSNGTYWAKKIDRNSKRDRQHRTALRRRGISVWRFWEHELKPTRLDAARRRIGRAVQCARARVVDNGR